MSVNDVFPVLNFVLLVIAAGIVIQEKRRQNTEKSGVRNFQGTDKDAVIASRLSQLRFAFDADRSKLYLFNNGGHFLNGASIKKMSLAYLQSKQNAPPTSVSKLQNLPTSLFPHMMNLLLKRKGIIAWTTEQAPDTFLRTNLIDEKVASVMIVGVWSKSNNLIGMISLNWCEVRRVHTDEPTLNEAAEEIGRILDNY